MLGDLTLTWRYRVNKHGLPEVIREFADKPTGQDMFATWQGFSAPLPGRHNVLNAAAAFAIGLALGLPSKAFAGLLDGFAGLPHRLEFVREAGGVRYYNDSKATTPEASEKAFTSFNQPIDLCVRSVF